MFYYSADPILKIEANRKQGVIGTTMSEPNTTETTSPKNTRKPRNANKTYEKPLPKKGLTVRMNHDIQCYLHENVALFRGDTYTYRGMFRRYGGLYSKEHKGYVVSHDRVSEVRSELTQMVSGFLVYNVRYKQLVINETELAQAFGGGNASKYIEDVKDNNEEPDVANNPKVQFTI